MVNCRGCSEYLSLVFLDLGTSPIANDLISKENLQKPEVFYPLRVMTCSECALVQLPEIASPKDLFRSDYVYFSSYSTTWLEHSRMYAEKMTKLLNLSSDDLVVEVASNDGYLLQYFAETQVQVLGIEPSAGVAEVAIQKGIPTIIEFFGSDLANVLATRKKPKLLLGNNVLAHVPDLHDFIKGFSILMSDEALITFEFPHLINLIRNNQFDTVYHEHFSYLSVTSLSPIFETYGLRVVNIEKLDTHGGSLRIFVAKKNSSWRVENSVQELLNEELGWDPRNESVWRSLQERTLRVKLDLLSELIHCRQLGLRVAAYGAAAKGNTLLNYCGIDSDLIEFVVDLNPHKQGNLLPGSRIPVVNIDRLENDTPDVLLLLPWNLADEVKAQLVGFTGRGMKLLKAVPNLEYF
jgi:hypothetical protein